MRRTTAIPAWGDRRDRSLLATRRTAIRSCRRGSWPGAEVATRVSVRQPVVSRGPNMVQARPIAALPETGRRSNGMATKVIVQHHVQDYERWKPVFDEHGAVRRQHGATGHRIHRSLD